MLYTVFTIITKSLGLLKREACWTQITNQGRSRLNQPHQILALFLESSRTKVRNEPRRHIHYQRQARWGQLIFFSGFIDFFSLVFCLGSFLCLLRSIHTIFETRTLPVSAFYLFLFLIISENSPQVDWIVRKILTLPLVSGLSGSFSPGVCTWICIVLDNLTWATFNDILNHTS